MEVTAETFERDVVARSHELPVVVDFWADWCGPCRVLGPLLEREVEARAGAVELAKVDVDANQELAREHRVQGIPAVKAFRDGRVVSEFVGVRSPAAVGRFLDELAGPSPAERVLAELRQTGEAPAVADALERGDVEAALELLLDDIQSGDRSRRDRLRELMVALFGHLGHEHPVATAYRRRLAAALY